MNDNVPILNMQFRDAVTGTHIDAHVTFEQWDNMVIVFERIVADYYKNKGLRKDLK